MSDRYFDSQRNRDALDRYLTTDPKDDPIPVVEISTRIHRARVARPGAFGCGHPIEPGMVYEKWVGLVDGEFTCSTTCGHCLSGMVDA